MDKPKNTEALAELIAELEDAGLTDEELAKELTGCRYWRWLPGMSVLDEPHRIEEVAEDGTPQIISGYGGDLEPLHERYDNPVPDLDDPATGYLLLHILIEELSKDGETHDIHIETDIGTDWRMKLDIGYGLGGFSINDWPMGPACALALLALEVSDER